MGIVLQVLLCRDQVLQIGILNILREIRQISEVVLTYSSCDIFAKDSLLE